MGRLQRFYQHQWFAKRRKSVKRKASSSIFSYPLQKKFKLFLKDLIVTLIQLFKELRQRCSQLTQNKSRKFFLSPPTEKNFSANVHCRAFVSHARLVSRLLFRENSKNCSNYEGGLTLFPLSKSKTLLKPPRKVRWSPISMTKCRGNVGIVLIFKSFKSFFFSEKRLF